MQFIEFIWPLLAYISKWAIVLLVIYIVGSCLANPSGTTPVLRNIIRYTLFVLIFPFMLIIGYIMRAITHPSDRP